jgi:hypothetical protein
MSVVPLFKLVLRLCSTLEIDGSGCSITIDGNCVLLLGTKARSSSGLRKLKLNFRILRGKMKFYE